MNGRFRLADGEIVDLLDDGIRAMYEELWKFSPRKGAASTAALLLYARWSSSSAMPVELDDRQSALFRLARSRLAPSA